MVATVDVRLAAWRVHATAWDVYRQAGDANAEIERSKAEEVILQVAKSLEGFEKLRQLFLHAKPVRRVLEAGTASAAPPPPLKSRKRSRAPA